MREQLTSEEFAHWTTADRLGSMVIMQVSTPSVVVPDTLLMGGEEGQKSTVTII